MSNLLKQINSPSDLKKLEIDDLITVAEEIRELIIDVVSKNGGHLGPNLGAVEFITAMHYVFNTPDDKFVFDVSHQAYPHKILTGRRESFKTIRTMGGLSGFTNRKESEHDAFGAGHACTALSAALGFATARDLNKEDSDVLAVVGDGSLTGGMAWEGLNQIGSSGRDIIVVLNDNKMSISKNVGAIAKYLTDVLADEPYNKLKAEIWKLSGYMPKHEKLRKAVAKIEESLKGVVMPGMIFEKFGLRYFGPIDGHDLKLLIKTFEQIKKLPGPKLLHILTVKGKGYTFAEHDIYRFHGVAKFDKMTGKSISISKSLPFTNVFGEVLTHLAGIDDKICAITAAMSSGTGLSAFSEKYPDRFFDVGIAEQHAVTFGAGLAAGGQKPFVAIYSTFLQRGFDQVLHDVALQNLPVVFCLDRAGLVGDDGPTHHGAFDISYLRAIPNIVIMAPKDGSELRDMLAFASVYNEGPVAIRYPRISIPEEHVELGIRPMELGKWEELRDGTDAAILAVGSMVYPAWKAADILEKDGISCSVINSRFIKPLDENMLMNVFENFDNVITVCENTEQGGFGEAIERWARKNGFASKNILNLEIPDSFVEHGNRNLLLSKLGLDSEGISVSILEMIQSLKPVKSEKEN